MSSLGETISEEEREAFLKALTKLSKKHKITIGGCGCCKSPWINKDTKIRNNAEYTVDNDGNLTIL